MQTVSKLQPPERNIISDIVEFECTIYNLGVRRTLKMSKKAKAISIRHNQQFFIKKLIQEFE